MDGYPVNLILTVAIASATLFLGFLPTKKIRPEFFAREMLWAALAWLVVAVISPPAILHYPLIFVFFCLAAWWQFREENLLKAKMWLTLASALGISIGVIFILSVTPRATGYPAGLSQVGEILLIASIYLGGAVIGLAYVCWVLTRSATTKSGISRNTMYRYVVLLPILALAHAAVLLGSCYFSGIGLKSRPSSSSYYLSNFLFAYSSQLELLLLALVVILLPTLTFLAKRAAHFSSRGQPTQILIAICGVGFLAEILARLLVL